MPRLFARAARKVTAPSRATEAQPPARQVGYAVIGLGHIAQESVLPAFAHAPNTRLAALVSSDDHKRKQLGKKYGVETYRYDALEECLARDDVDAVYIALPNHMHAEFTVRCANAGVHVLCEKPMALDDDECERMIAACRDNDVRLMIGYRLHFEAANLSTIQLANSGQLGDLRYFSSVFSYQVRPENIRTDAEKGGGPLWDLGVYPINATRYLFRSEPIAVFAFCAERSEDERFRDVYESISAVMKFPDDRLAQFTVSFGAATTGKYTLIGAKGTVTLDNAFEYALDITQTVDFGGKSTRKVFKQRDQFGAELQYFSDCVLEHRDPEPSGKEGRADVRIIEALHESLHHKRAVQVQDVERLRRPEPKQNISLPPTRTPELVDVAPPHQ